jgi:rhamnulokinase/L-fuculokinase
MYSQSISVDLGASSGRVMLGRWDGHALGLDELHRFSNDPVRVNGTLYWDMLRLLHEIKQGLSKAAQRGAVASIGIDTWGVDFALLNRQGQMLANPVHYRDDRTDSVPEAVAQLIPPRALYEETGLQALPFNTVYQLYALRRQDPDLLARAHQLLFLPDLLGYFLTGQAVTELSIARTSQLLNVHTLRWSEEVFGPLDLPRGMFAKLVPAGTTLGTLLPEVQAETGLGPVPVISVCGHDTQSAVCAVPSKEDKFVFLSSGTWSLLGTELDEPIVSDLSFRHNITNEGGAGKTRFLKNITGLWLIQESRRWYNRQCGNYGYADLERLALEAPAFQRFINPDDPLFAGPGNIPQRIHDFCAKTGQPVPQSVGETVRCIYESLALKYRATLEKLQDCTGTSYPCLHVIGGGVKDTLLCQMTASACGIPVLAGPAEATVLGSIAVQMIARNELADLTEARRAIANSTQVQKYTPEEEAAWTEAYRSFTDVAL